MKKYTSFRFLIGIVILILLNNTKGITQEPPTAFLKVIRIKDQKVNVKRAGETVWQEVNKYAQLFPDDSLKIPEDAAIILGDTESKWKEYKGHKVLMVKKKHKKKSAFGKFVERLYITFFKEPNKRRYSTDAVRSSDALLIRIPDSVFALSMPESLKWIKSAPWWTQYRVNITFQDQIVLDTIITGTTINLNKNNKRWQAAEEYKIKVFMPYGTLLLSEVDSCVIKLLDENQKTIKHKLYELKNKIKKKSNIKDYFEIVNFCLNEKLFLEMESYLFQMIKTFPDNPEPKIMLYYYYSSFIPEDRVEQLMNSMLK